MPIKQMTKEDFLEKFNLEGYKRILEALAKYPDAVAVVVFECLDLWSSHQGARQSLVVGPSNTYKTVAECEGRWLNDTPSQRMYPTSWISVDDLLNLKPPKIVGWI